MFGVSDCVRDGVWFVVPQPTEWQSKRNQTRRSKILDLGCFSCHYQGRFPMRDYYRILGIRSDATQEDIKDAWNFSVKAFHPDKFASSSPRQQAVAQERTKAINEAYEVLSDPIKRANYDWQYARGRPTHTPPPPPPPRYTTRGPS